MSNYSKSSTAKALGISTSELEKKARSAGYSNTESYAKAKGVAVYGGGEGGNYTDDAINVANQMVALQQKANQLAISALEKTQAPLEKRYNDLIASIKGNQTIAENRQTTTTNNELAKRGILPTSGMYQQEMTNALNPVTQSYTSQITDTANQKEVALKDLATQIAQLKSGASTTGISQGLGLYNQGVQQKNTQTSNDLAKQIYENVTLPGSQADNAYKNALTLKASLGGDTTGTWE